MFRLSHDSGKIFSCLPSVGIMACDVRQGDVAFINNHWMFVSHYEHDTKMYQKNNFLIHDFDQSTSYVEKNEMIRIIQRDLLDRLKINTLIGRIKAEEKKLQDIRNAECICDPDDSGAQENFYCPVHS